MNKFLNFCFTFGKWFVSVVLVLLLITGIYLGGSVINNTFKADSYKMDYKFAINEPTQQQTTTQTKNTYKEDIIKAFGENKPTDRFVNKTVKFIETKVDERDVVDVITNLPAYYNDVKAFIFDTIKKENKLSDTQVQQDYKNFRNDWDDIILEKYTIRYAKQSQARIDQKTQSETARTTALIALLVALCMFVMFLIVPILIRIEENTRK